MSLVERLGYKSVDNLYRYMDNNQIMEWMAFDLTQDPEWLENYKKELDIQQQKEQSSEEEARKIRALFMRMGHKPNAE